MAYLKYLKDDESKNKGKIDEVKYKSEKLLDWTLNKVIEGNGKRAKVIEEQKIELRRYFDYLKAQGLASTSIFNQIHHVYMASINIKKAYNDWNIDDLIHYIANSRLTKSSMSVHKVYVRKFFNFLGKKELFDNIRIERLQPRKLDYNDLLNLNDIKLLVEGADNIRDKCLVMVLYEGGLRVGELCSIRLKNLEEFEDGFRIKVTGKTGSRTLPFINSKPYIKELLNNHPYKKDLDSPLFINYSHNQFGRQIGEAAVHRALTILKTKIKFNKKIYPHLFRHSRLTYLAQFLTEQQLRIFAGWTKDSVMVCVYLHENEKRVEDRLLEIHNKIPSQKTIEDINELAPKVCDNCNEVNLNTNLYCKCGNSLDKSYLLKTDEKMIKINTIMEKLIEDDEFKAILKEFMKKKLL